MHYDLVSMSPGFGAVHFGHALLINHDYQYSIQPAYRGLNDNEDLFPTDALALHTLPAFLVKSVLMRFSALRASTFKAIGWANNASCGNSKECNSGNCDGLDGGSKYCKPCWGAHTYCAIFPNNYCLESCCGHAYSWHWDWVIGFHCDHN